MISFVGCISVCIAESQTYHQRYESRKTLDDDRCSLLHKDRRVSKGELW